MPVTGVLGTCYARYEELHSTATAIVHRHNSFLVFFSLLRTSNCGSALRAPSLRASRDFTPGSGVHQCATPARAQVVLCSL